MTIFISRWCRSCDISHVVCLLAACLFAAAPVNGAQVYLEYSPGAAKVLDDARDRLEKNEPAEAARLVQQVFDEHGGKLLRLKQGRYAESRQVAVRFILKEKKLLEYYRQLYDPIAAHRLTLAAGDRGKLLDLVNHYALTDAGLKAGMRLAGLSLEAGEADAAQIALDRLAYHPALDKRKVLYDQLRAVASLMRSDRATFKSIRDQLFKNNHVDAVKALDNLGKQITRKSFLNVLNPLDLLPDATPPSETKTPLWSNANIRGIYEYLLRSRNMDARTLESQIKSARFLNTLPVLADGLLYINDGYALSAIEPSSGRSIWRQEVSSVYDQKRSRFSGYYRSYAPTGGDMNLLGVASGRVVGIMGYRSLHQTYSYYARSLSISKLLCVDARNGKPHWNLYPEEIDSDLAGAFFYGRPIVSQGRVYVLTRKRLRNTFQACHVLAIDLRTGKKIWKRHVAHTAINRSTAIPGMSHMQMIGGYIYVDSRLGTVAKLSASDGSVVWLSTIDFDEVQQPRTFFRPWSASSPVLTPAGLTFYDNWTDTIRVLSADAGKPENNIRAALWHDPFYLMPLAGDIISIGDKILRVDGKTLEAKWTYNWQSDGDDELKGRASIARNLLYLPTGKGVHVIDLKSGKRQSLLPISTPANLFAIDGQLITTTYNTVHSYSTWDVASKQLEKRMAAYPDDARPTMGYVWLAFKTNRADALLSKLDRAIKLSQQTDDKTALGGELFDQLLEMARNEKQPNQKLRQELFDRIAAISQGPQQEVAFRLALARFHEANERISDAVDHYQMVLSEPTYRKQLYIHIDGSRQAGLEAQRRIELIFKKHGRKSYERYEAYADQTLNDLKNQNDPAPLIELADAYPLAKTAPTALRYAAERTFKRGNMREAIALLRRAGQLTTDPTAIAAIYGRQAELYEKANQPHRARRLLRRLLVIYPKVKPLRSGAPVDARIWIEDLALQLKRRGANKQLNLPLSTSAKTFYGQLMKPSQQDPDVPRPRAFLVQATDRLTLYNAATLKKQWDFQLPPIAGRRTYPPGWITLLSIDRSRIWLWYKYSRRLQVLDTATGRVRWEQPQVDNKLEDIKLKAITPPKDERAEMRRNLIVRGGARVIINGRVVGRERTANQSTSSQTIIAVSDLVVAVADQFGRLIVFDADTGRMNWKAASAIRNTTMLKSNGRYVMIAGTDADHTPTICVYDAQTNALIHRLRKPKNQPIKWMGISDDGVLLFVSNSQVESFDLDRGQSRWVAKPAVKLLGKNASWIGATRIVVQSEDGDLIFVNLADGIITGRFPLRHALSGNVKIVADGVDWFIVTQDHAIALDNNGKPRWRDGIAASKALVAHELSDRYLVLLNNPTVADFANSHDRRLYLLDRATGSIVLDQYLTASEHLGSIAIVDGKLVLSSRYVTAALASPKPKAP